MKTYRIMKEVKAENLYDLMQKERFVYPKAIEEMSSDGEPMGFTGIDEDDELRKQMV